MYVLADGAGGFLVLAVFWEADEPAADRAADGAEDGAADGATEGGTGGRPLGHMLVFSPTLE
jgi:hypothetical protein